MIVIAYKEIYAKIGSALGEPAVAKEVMTTLLHIDWAVNGVEWSAEPSVFALDFSGQLIQIGGPELDHPEKILITGHGDKGKIGNLKPEELVSLATQLEGLEAIGANTDLHVTACFGGVAPEGGESIVQVFQNNTTKFNVFGFDNTTVTHSVFGNTIHVVGAGNENDWMMADTTLQVMHRASLFGWCQNQDVTDTGKGLNAGNKLRHPNSYETLMREATNVAHITSNVYEQLITTQMAGKCATATV